MTPTQRLEERFDSILWKVIFKHLTPETIAFIKSEFESELSLQKQALAEKVEAKKARPILGGILGPENYQRGFTMGHENGYLQAISDILALIKED